eukprot:NODE_15003_length_1073_cov_4.677590.p1 GENE.NODE_15003_length_1073_cov_4.677590~~NODE_15003_length_1073_cov_4.677590.p1  ORF type:complete len:282 (-),score=40.18 NODE_15003_length_1073_cov_4.677590:125-970(-)
MLKPSTPGSVKRKKDNRKTVFHLAGMLISPGSGTAPEVASMPSLGDTTSTSATASTTASSMPSTSMSLGTTDSLDLPPSLPLAQRRTHGDGTKTRKTSRRETLSMLFMGNSAGNNTKPRYDVLTLRMWFHIMDRDGQGAITSKRWIAFMRQNPTLRQNLFACSAWQQEESDEAQVRSNSSTAKECKRLLSLWRSIAVADDGTLNFDEFVEFFRLSGNLLEYNNTHNPRTILADTLSDIWEGDLEPTPQNYREFKTFCRQHLGQDTRRWILDETSLICEDLW